MLRALARMFDAHPIAAPIAAGAASLLVARALPEGAATAAIVGGVGLLGYAGVRLASGAGDLLRPNPAPTAWRTQAADTPYPCTPREGRMVGTRVPGKRGGIIVACATPSKAHPHEGQYWFGLPVVGVGEPVRKSTVRRRLRDEGKPRRADAREAVEQGAHYWRSDPAAIPYPLGLEFSHIVGTSRCDAEHRVWRGYDAALERAQASANARGPRDQTEFNRYMSEALSREPGYKAWASAADKCAASFLDRESGRKGKAGYSSQREAAQKRAAAIARGEDVTGAEYRDTLRSAERGQRRR